MEALSAQQTNSLEQHAHSARKQMEHQPAATLTKAAERRALVAAGSGEMSGVFREIKQRKLGLVADALHLIPPPALRLALHGTVGGVL